LLRLGLGANGAGEARLQHALSVVQADCTSAILVSALLIASWSTIASFVSGLLTGMPTVGR